MMLSVRSTQIFSLERMLNIFLTLSKQSFSPETLCKRTVKQTHICCLCYFQVSTKFTIVLTDPTFLTKYTGSSSSSKNTS